MKSIQEIKNDISNSIIGLQDEINELAEDAPRNFFKIQKRQKDIKLLKKAHEVLYNG